MTALEFIQQNAAKGGLEFLVIGGLAVIEHGYARRTTNIDLAMRGSAKESWSRLLTGGGYQLVNDGGSFLQYERPDTGSWPLDLMLVSDATFTGLAGASLPATVMSAAVPLVSLDHLFALKLHVLKQGRLTRFLDDLNDVVELVRVNRIDLESPAIATCSSVMEPKTSSKKYSDLPGPGSPMVLHEATLEFPDGRDFVSVVNRRAPDGFLDYCASHLSRIRQRADYRRRRLESGCDAEFDLDHPERVTASYSKDLLDMLLKGI